MKRREFLKSSLFFAAISTVIGKASGILNNNAHAAAAFAAVGKLGYKEVSPQVGNGKTCTSCKHFKANAEAGAGAGAGGCSAVAVATLFSCSVVPTAG